MTTDMKLAAFTAILAAGIISTVVIFTVRTSPPTRVLRCDKVAQREVFLACLDKLPKGPEIVAATGNDWDEVVSECRASASAIACDMVEVKP